MVSVRRYEPTFLAMLAGMASAKKNQRWPPLPERERSKATGSANRWQVSRNALASSCQASPSRSTASK